MASSPNQSLHTHTHTIKFFFFFFNVFTLGFVNFSPQLTTATSLWALHKNSCVGFSVASIKMTREKISD